MRFDFPMLNRQYEGKSLIYFDNAASSLKPKAVLDSVLDYYQNHSSNVHRGPNFLSEEATALYEGARTIVAKFINSSPKETIFTSGATMGINLITRSWGETNLKTGDVIAISRAEHHANLVPWLQLKAKLDLKIVYIEVASDGSLIWGDILNTHNLKLLAVTQASNVLGSFYDLKNIMAEARAKNIMTVVDAAQSIAHHPVDVKDLGCDFLVFSGHKLLAETGIGILYGREELLEQMPPFLSGGAMIADVSGDSFTPAELPAKFEAGTPNISGAISLGAACLYLNYDQIIKQEQELTNYFLTRLKELDFVTLIGNKKERLPLFSMTFDGMHPHDVADLLGEEGIITRAGHHCAQPLHDSLKISATLRASLSFYNNKAEIDIFIEALTKIHKLFNA
jgi:cysteine desulfurase / selenocysteine lyase